jgi:hypothetical protein
MIMNRLLKIHIFFLFILISSVLYFPWRNNPLIFDDINILKSTDFYEIAQNPFSIIPRHFPYFTLGFENVIFNGDFSLSRCVNLVLHGANGFLLFLLINTLFKRSLSARRAFLTALFASVIFIIHPIAVYAVAYLIQRTILFATFFLLLSALQFDRALSERSNSRALLAGLCFGFSVLSKEHALGGLIGVMGILWIRPNDKDNGVRNQTAVLLSFLAIALPFALWVSFLKLGWVGTAYEPDAMELISSANFPNWGSALSNWMFSASMQCLFFFRYLAFWVWPDPSALSIDIRPDFNYFSNFPWPIVGPLLLAGLVILVTVTLRSRKTNSGVRFASFGLLWVMGLFLIELSTVRFQEPIVLYRSYLWAPGFLLALAGIASNLPIRAALVGAGTAILACIPLSSQRLSTFSDELILWQEASHKLPQPTTAGSVRIHYNLGVFQLRERQTNEALANFEWVIHQDPNSFRGYWGRASVRAFEGSLALAADDLATVVRLKPDHAIAYYQYGLLLKKLGRTSESEVALAKAKNFGIPAFQIN